MVDLQNVCKSWHEYKMVWNVETLKGNMFSDQNSLLVWN